MRVAQKGGTPARRARCEKWPVGWNGAGRGGEGVGEGWVTRSGRAEELRVSRRRGALRPRFKRAAAAAATLSATLTDTAALTGVAPPTGLSTRLVRQRQEQQQRTRCARHRGRRRRRCTEACSKRGGGGRGKAAMRAQQHRGPQRARPDQTPGPMRRQVAAVWWRSGVAGCGGVVGQGCSGVRCQLRAHPVRLRGPVSSGVEGGRGQGWEVGRGGRS